MIIIALLARSFQAASSIPNYRLKRFLTTVLNGKAHSSRLCSQSLSSNPILRALIHCVLGLLHGVEEREFERVDLAVPVATRS